MRTSDQIARAISRLKDTPDFALFMHWLTHEKDEGYKALLQASQPHVIHQLQGSTRVLEDILQAVRLARPVPQGT